MTWPKYLKTRFCQYNGITLDRPHWKTTGATSTLGCHWNHTGWCYHQWCPIADPVLICIIGTYWKNTGATSTLRCHWNYTGWCHHPVMSQRRSSVNLHNWNTLEHRWKDTEKPLESHWKHTGYQQFFLQWHSSVHWGLNSRHTGLPLDCHWITTGSG